MDMYTNAQAHAVVADAIATARRVLDISDRDEAAQRWHDAKRREDDAKADRLKAEGDIVRLFGAKPEGSQTAKTERFKVKTTANLTYKIDAAAFVAAKSEIPKAVRDACVRTKYEASVSGLRALAAADPDMYRKFADFLSIEQAKTSVEVEKL
jgi:hypothetical protein